jgi:hypothetical protein
MLKAQYIKIQYLIRSPKLANVYSVYSLRSQFKWLENTAVGKAANIFNDGICFSFYFVFNVGLNSDLASLPQEAKNWPSGEYATCVTPRH